MAYAILRTSKVSSAGGVAALGQHLEREKLTENASQELEHLNRRVIGSGDLWADVQARMSEAGVKPQKDSVLAVELLMTASPEHFRFQLGTTPDGRATLVGDFEKVDRFEKLAKEWLEREYGPKNVVNLTRHMDEGNPHWHAVVVPIVHKTVKVGRSVKREVEQNRLSARDYFNGRDTLSKLQDRFAEQMQGEGLNRGIKHSTAKHSEVRAFYGAISHPETMQELKERVSHRGEARQELTEMRSETSNLLQLSLSLQEERKRLEEEKNRILAENQRLKVEADKLKQQQEALKASTEKLEQENNRLQFNYAFTKAAVVKQEQALDDLTKELNRKQSNGLRR